MIRYNNSIVLQFDNSATGNAGSGKKVTVRNKDNTLPALYNALGEQITNPVTSDGEGNYWFYIDDGIYDLIIDEGLPSETRIEDEQIVDVVNFDPIGTIEEVQTITAPQTTVTFSVVDVSVASIYVGPQDGDRGRLFRSVDYTVTNSTTIELTKTDYPTGTEILAVSIENIASIDRYTRKFANLDAAKNDTTLKAGDSCDIKERTTGNGGGAMWDVVLASTVTPNGFDIVQCIGVPTLALVKRDKHYNNGTQIVTADVTLSGRYYFTDFKLQPASGVTITLASDCYITSNSGWQDTSQGGSFAANAGSMAEIIPDKVTSPTGGFIYSLGYPLNTIDESSGTSFVFGGTDTLPHTLGPSSQLCVIGGGYDNNIINDAIASIIAGGAHHIVDDGASHSAILGGSFQKSTADYGALVGGTQNTVNSTFSFNGAGQTNIVGDENEVALDFRSAANVAGTSNTVNGLRAFNGAGFTNTITTAGEQAGTVAGQNNTLSGKNSFNGAGATNQVSGEGAACIAGASNEASGLSSLAHGSSNKATGNYAIALGEFGEANGSGSMVTGRRAKADLFGERAHASGYFAAKGDAQISDLVARFQTNGATPQNLDLFGGTSNPIVLADNTTWIFTIKLVARRTDAAENAMYEFVGGIKRDAGVASTALVGTPTKTVIAEDNAAWDANVSADTTNGALQVQVTGAAGATVRWVARIELTKAQG